VIQQGSARVLCIADVRGEPNNHQQSLLGYTDVKQETYNHSTSSPQMLAQITSSTLATLASTMTAR
jgi:hypothetical protein